MRDRAEKAARRGDPTAQRQLVELEEQLRMPPFPEALRYLWTMFLRLRRRVAGSGFGPAAITWVDIDACCRLLRVRLAPWEVEIIEALDDTYLSVSPDPPPEN